MKSTPDSKYVVANYCMCGHHLEAHPTNGRCKARGMRIGAMCNCQQFNPWRQKLPGVTRSGKET